MKDFVFIYRCRRCGGIEHNPKIALNERDEAIATMKLADAIRQHKTGFDSVHLLTLHSCPKSAGRPDGVGVADLIGYDEEPKP